MTTFTADVDAWVALSKARMLAVFQIATQDLFFEVIRRRSNGGLLPHDTGFLGLTFDATLNEPNLTVRRRPDDAQPDSYQADRGAIALTILQAELGDTVFGVFGANYARYLEDGVRGRPGAGFVKVNAARWTDFVDEATVKARAAA